MRYKILKDFPGSQDGRFTENFKAGTEAELSDYLAAIVVPEGWAAPVAESEGEAAAEAHDKKPAKAKKVTPAT